MTRMTRAWKRVTLSAESLRPPALLRAAQSFITSSRLRRRRLNDDENGK